MNPVDQRSAMLFLTEEDTKFRKIDAKNKSRWAYLRVPSLIPLEFKVSGEYNSKQSETVLITLNDLI